MQGHLDTIGKRLRWAIERRPRDGRQRGNRKFQRDIEQRSKELGGTIPGVSLPSIMSYLNGPVEPSLPFLREAARICGVNVDWLTYGTGHPTPAHEKAADTSAEALVSPGLGLELFKAIIDEAGLTQTDLSEASAEITELAAEAMNATRRPVDEVKTQVERFQKSRVPYWIAPLGEVWLTLSIAMNFLNFGPEAGPAEVRIAKAIVDPIRAMGLDPKRFFLSDHFDRYILGLLPALYGLSEGTDYERSSVSEERAGWLAWGRKVIKESEQ